MLPEQIQAQKILFSPLNWGMGHVSRSIALIHQWLQQQNTVYIACSASQQQIYESYFTGVHFLAHEEYPFAFSGNGNFGMDLFAQRRKLLFRFTQETREVAQWVEELAIDYVISDHRYGFFSKKVPSIFITHQLHLPLKWFQKPIQYFHQKLIQNFSSVWVLDDEKSTLSGKLSAKIRHQNLIYIGWKSRFQLPDIESNYCDTLFLVSGPLPYSQDFFNECIEMAKKQSGNNVCIFPKDLKITTKFPENLICLPSNDWHQIDSYIKGAKFIISRSGYSTLMDLKVLAKKYQLIPTPGQAEQIYLAKIS